MKVLVTGGAGYIGNILVPRLLEENYEVTVLDRFFFGDYFLEHKNLTKIRADSRNYDPGILKGVDAVIDLVAISNDPSGEAFEEATYQINYESRVNTAKLAKKQGVKRYILPSSCSIYGFQEENVVADENSPTNPLTSYAKANELAEKEILPLADDNFIVTVVRQATVDGYSPRMRFDLAINGMTYGAWKEKKLPLMRDGKQWRPMIHIHDTSNAIIFMLKQSSDKVNAQIFNAGSSDNVYQLGNLAERVIKSLGEDIPIEWYGDRDVRSYNVSFKKINNLGFKTSYFAEDGVKEIVSKLEDGKLRKSKKTITLDWYKEITTSKEKVKELELNGKMLNF